MLRVRCCNLDFEARARRLQQHMAQRADALTVPGRCQVCGHVLPIAYRAMRCINPHEDPRKAEYECKEEAPGSEGALEFERRIGAGTVDHFPADGWIILRVSACAGIDEAIWKRMRKLQAEEKLEALKASARGPGEKPRRMRGDPVQPFHPSRPQLYAHND